MSQTLRDPVVTGQRISKDQHRGTVRYVGELRSGPFPPGTMWAGVEWDEAGRGKNNGSHDGIQYFETAPGNGSFLKLGTFDVGISFLEALTQKYVGAEDAEPVPEVIDDRVGEGARSFSVLAVGVRKIYEKQNNLQLLKEVFVNDLCVSHAGPENLIAERCCRIEHLDLSNNLFTSWTEIVHIIRNLPNLNVLVLSGNRFREFAWSAGRIAGQQFPSVHTVVLNNMGPRSSWDDVMSIIRMFPNLETLHCCDNSLSSLRSTPAPSAASAEPSTSASDCSSAPSSSPEILAQHFPKLSSVIVDRNVLSSWSEIAEWFGQLGALTKLSVSGNPIDTIQYRSPAEATSTSTDPVSSVFAKLESLSIADTRIHSWSDIDSIPLRFPSLSDLRAQHIPLAETFSANVFRQHVIARVPCLTSLNGSLISARERNDAERFLLRLAHDEKQRLVRESAGSDSSGSESVTSQLARQYPQYDHWVSLYGVPASSTGDGNSSAGGAGGSASTSGTASMVWVSIRSNAAASCARPAVRKRIPTGMTVQKLKLVVQQAFRIAPAVQRLFLNTGSPVADFLDDDTKDLAYYGFVRDDLEVVVEEADPAKELAEKKRAEMRQLELMRQQENQVDDLVRLRLTEVSDSKRGVSAAQQL